MVTEFVPNTLPLNKEPASFTALLFPEKFSVKTMLPVHAPLQRQNTEISIQIFPEKEYRGLSPNFHIHPSVSDLYIPTLGLPILL